jgi:hypothetical protein
MALAQAATLRARSPVTVARDLPRTPCGLLLAALLGVLAAAGHRALRSGPQVAQAPLGVVGGLGSLGHQQSSGQHQRGQHGASSARWLPHLTGIALQRELLPDVASPGPYSPAPGAGARRAGRSGGAGAGALARPIVESPLSLQPRRMEVAVAKARPQSRSSARAPGSPTPPKGGRREEKAPARRDSGAGPRRPRGRRPSPPPAGPSAGRPQVFGVEVEPGSVEKTLARSARS